MSDKSNQSGAVLVALMVITALVGCMMVFMLFIAAGSARTTSGAGVREPGAADDPPTSTDDEPIDLGTGMLVCVDMPGVHAPKTPALDRRVARKLLAVRLDLQAQGIPPLRFTYGFRSTREQIAVNPGGNLKAAPGTSPHEAGRAVDVSGMRTRPDRSYIIATFKRHGWQHLGLYDLPHFQIPAEAVGEPNRIAMIWKAQADYARGNPVGCRGGSRRPAFVPNNLTPERRLQRIEDLYG